MKKQFIKNSMFVFLVGMFIISTLGSNFIVVQNVKADEAPEKEWESVFKVWGGGRSGQQTVDGGYIAVGYTNYYGSGGKNLLLIKIDAYGKEQWHQTYGSVSSWDVLCDVKQTSDGGYIIANANYLIKTNIDGIEQWRREICPGKYLSIKSLYQSNDDGFIMIGVGQVRSNGEYHPKIFLIKTDDKGNEQWNRSFGDNAKMAGSVKQTLDGGYIISGENSGCAWLIKTDEKGNEQWNKIFDQYSIGYFVQQTLDGGYILTGGVTYTYGGDQNFLLIKTDENGDEQWRKSFGGEKSDYGRCVKQTRDGGYIIIGNTYSFDSDSYSTIWVVRTDENGDMKWNKTFSKMDASGWSVQQTSDGGYFIVGSTNVGTVATDSDFWLIKIKPDEPALDDNGDQITDIDSENGTPGFELVLVICAISLILIWKRKSKNL